MSTPSDSPTHNQSGTVYPLSRLPPLQSSHLSSTDDYSSQPTDSGINTNHPPVTAESERAPASEPLTQLPLLKNLQTSSPGLGWLTVIISIGLHGLLMLMPIPSAHQPAPPKPKKQIRVTQIPIPTLPKSSGVQAAPKPSSTPKKIPPAPKPVVRSQIVIPSVSKTPIRDTRSEPKPKAQPTPFEPQPKAQPTPSEPKPKAQPTPSEPQPKAQQDTQKQPTTAATSAPLASTSDPWLDFPNYPGAKPGCFGLSACYQTSKELAQVGAHFEKELQAKQYDVKPDIQEANRKVYQVSKAGRTEFLSLVFAGGQEGTVYVRGPDRLSLGDFKTAVAVPPEVSNILNGLDPQKADPSYFAQPELFYTKQGTQGANANSDAPLPGISNISLISDQTADTLMDAFLRTNLRNNNFEVSDPPKHYAEGTLYEVKNGNNLTLYINLIPTKDQKGTLVVIWGSPPI